MQRVYDVKGYERKVLDALGMQHIKTNVKAEEVWQQLGIEVYYRREGRSTVPTVKILDNRTSAAWNGNGDADAIDRNYNLTAEQYEAIKQWISN
jgi:hypothetical protein